MLLQEFKNLPTLFGEQLAKDLESWEAPSGEGQLLRFLPQQEYGRTSDPGCLEAIEATYSSCLDLKDTLLENAETWKHQEALMEVAMSSVEGMLVFSGKMACPQDNYSPGLVDGVREQNGPPVIQEEAVRELLSCLDIHKSMGSDGIHPLVMRELADELAKPLSIIYQQSWFTGEVPDDWKLANVTSIHKKVGKEDPGNYRPVSLTSVPAKVTHLVDGGKAVDVACLDFSKAFDSVSLSILLDVLA
ncbi:hypothetical protein DUI87_05108 [Hirundo rustica rustica]|uniref:Reverse transcriptase domain-containing protein n=1 Tax=Hirundo rustica rustica TaxID=333673 RepID=A0A3M0LGK5_HIRRU|nr:hypothetical protein DUI87_05108 [Hirundo rustica rustica]